MRQVNETFDFNVAVRPTSCTSIATASSRNDGQKVRGWIRGNEDLTGQVLELDVAELNLFNMIVDTRCSR